MADITRTAKAVWNGDLKGGKGTLDATSGVLKATPYSFATRFEQAPGTNPEELIAAAHAGCFSMAFAHTLAGKGHVPEAIETSATCHLSPQPTGGFKITKMALVTRGKVPGMDAATFKQIALEVQCPVSTLLKPGLEIEIDAALL